MASPGIVAKDERAVPTSDPPHQPNAARTATIMAALSLAVFLAAVDSTIVATALPSITEGLSSAAGYTWIGSSYFLAVTAALPVWGKCSEIWGRKLVILAANVIFFVGSLLCALSVNMAMMIAARAIQGTGAAGLVILVNIIVSDLFSIRERAKYLGVISGVYALAGAIGPLLGGAFAQKGLWRWCFYINLPLDGLAFLILLIFLNVHSSKTALLTGLKSIDTFGIVTVTGGAVMFLLGLQFGGITFPWVSAAVICLIVFGCSTLAIFVLIEWYIGKTPNKRPVIPLRVFHHRSSVAILAVCFVHGMFTIAPFYYLPLYFQSVRGATPILSGVYVLPIVLSSAFVSMFVGRFTQRTGLIVQPIWFGMALSTLGLGLLIDLDAGSGWAKIIIYQLLAGAGFGPIYFSPIVALQRRVQLQDIAVAVSTLGFVRQLGSSISIVVGGAIFQSQMQGRVAGLIALLGEDLAGMFSGGDAAANVPLIGSLPEEQKAVVKVAFANSIRPMWYLYVALAALGFMASLLIDKYTLSQANSQVAASSGAGEKPSPVEKEESVLKPQGGIEGADSR